MADPALLATCLAAALALPPPPTAPVPRDMPTKPAAPQAVPPASRAPESPTAIEGPAPAPTPTPTATKPILAGACHGSRPCDRLVILGSVTGALGVATVIAGAALTARPIAIDPDDPTMAITYRPAGTAVLTIGIGVLATSLLMTLAAVRASRQARRAAMTQRQRQRRAL